MRPASEALAFRIWALCQPRGWGMTIKDCAEELGEDWRRVNRIVAAKKWHDRFKAEVSAEEFVRFRKGISISWMPSGADCRAVIRDLAGERREAAE